jgi:tRNA nucleotidyltransferase/poly(A) polymerase
VEKDGQMRIVSPGHDRVSAILADEFLLRMKAPNIIRERVIPLVAQHMIHVNTITDRAVRRLAKRLEPETIPSLCTVMSADAMGRPPLSTSIPEHIHEIRKRAEELDVLSNAPTPFLKGRDLMAMGIEPGKQMGEWLQQAYELQLEGELENREKALNWVRVQTNRPPNTGGPCD